MIVVSLQYLYFSLVFLYFPALCIDRVCFNIHVHVLPIFVCGCILGGVNSPVWICQKLVSNFCPAYLIGKFDVICRAHTFNFPPKKFNLQYDI